jgi:hypothetical protein
MKKCLKHQKTFFHNNHLWQIELKVRIWWNQQTIQKIKQIKALKINSKDLNLRFKIYKRDNKIHSKDFLNNYKKLLFKSIKITNKKILIL